MNQLRVVVILLLAVVVLAACGGGSFDDKNRREAHGVYEVKLDGQDVRLIENAYCRASSPGFGSELYVYCYSHVIDDGRRVWPDYDSRFLIGRLEVVEILEAEG